jgi:hypothetical protein
VARRSSQRRDTAHKCSTDSENVYVHVASGWRYRRRIHD